MTDRLSRWERRIAPFLCAAALLLGPMGTPTVRAQEPEAAEKSEGDPVPGYLGVLLLCIGVMFAVGKSARR